jgi:alpha-mannosidase
VAIKAELHIIPGSHLDYGWAASPGECFAYITENIRMAVDDITQDAPGYKFTIEYAIFMKHFLEIYPDYLPKVRELVKAGSIEVCPSMSGFIEQFLDGEMVIHELVQAKEWIRETLGVDPVTAQHTDLPGHIIQIPQFLRGAGIMNFAYSRYHPPIPLHRWRAPNGSEVIACCHRHAPIDQGPCSWEGYGWGWVRFVYNDDMEIVYKELPKEIEESLAVWPDPTQPILMGCESDLQPPEPAMLPRIVAWNERYPDTPIHVSTISQFFEHVRAEKLPVFQGEAPYAFFSLPSIYLTSSLEMRHAENALAAGSKWSVFQQHLGLGKAQSTRIKKAMDALALPHDHNTGGRRGEINDVERYKDSLHARLEGESVLQESAMSVTVNIDYRHQPKESYPVVVFNSLSWNRSDVVETYVELPMAGVESLVLTDSRGIQVPCQILKTDDAQKFGWSRVYFVFVAPDVPAHGYSTFYLKPSKDVIEEDTSIKVSNSRLQNHFFDIRIRDNHIQSIRWNDRELAGKGERHFNEAFMLEDKMDNIEAPPWAIEQNYTGRTWDGVVRKVEVIEKGPVRAILRFHGKVGKSSLCQDVILYDRIDRIDFKHILDYKAKMHTQTRVAFPLNVPEASITYESPYGTVRMDKDEMPGTFRGHGERWVQKWVDLSNQDFGVTIATRQISHVLSEKGVEPIIARTATDCGTLFHYTEQNHVYHYWHSLSPHAHDWKKAATHRAGWELNNPLYSCNMTTCFPIKPIRRSRSLPECHSLWTISGKNAVITSISTAKDPGSFIFRVVEYYGIEKDLLIQAPFTIQTAEEVNFLEEKLCDIPIDSKGIHFHATKYGIHTLKVRLAE